MNILGFDTDTDMLTVALKAADRLHHFKELHPRLHLKYLIPKIDALVKESKIKKTKISFIAVGLGPGSFTGLRIGLATAQTLAHALNKPLIGVPTLDIMAKKLSQEKTYLNFKYICIALDAKKGEVYSCLYRRKELQLDKVNQMLLLKPETLVDQLKKVKEPVLLAGDAALSYKTLFSERLSKQLALAEQPFWYPDAAVLIQLAQEKIEENKFKPYFQVLPIYMRPAKQ